MLSPSTRTIGGRTSAASLAFLTLTLALPAVEVADLAGDWSIAEFTTPSRLRETYFNHVTETTRTSADSTDFAGPDEILVDAFYPDPTVTATRGFSISPGGAVTGDETGQILGVSSNRMLYSDGSELTTLYSNTAGEILLVSGHDVDQQEQTLCLKRPTDLTNADLTGDWSLITMTNPDDLSKSTDGSGRISDVYFPGDTSLASGGITVDGAGNFTGIFSGTISGTPAGDVTVVSDGSIAFKANASKNVLSSTPGDDDEQEYIVLVKKPATLTTADLAGTWRISVIRIPITLTETFYNTVTMGSRQADSSGTAIADEILVDMFHSDPFELDRLRIEVDAAGNFTGSTTGTVTANGDRSVSLSSDGDVTPLYPNADKTFMIGSAASTNYHELILCIKTSNSIGENAEEAADLQVIKAGGSLILSWNSTNMLRLEESSVLSGWTEVDGTSGSDSYVADPASASTRFFRIAERP